MPLLGFSPGLDVGTTSHQCCASCIGFQSTEELTLNWRALSSCLCPARHLCIWLMTYTWSRKILDIGCVRLLTDRVLIHAPTTCLATEVLLPPGHASGTASQHTYATRTSRTELSGVNWKHTGFNVMTGAQCGTCIIVLYEYSYWTKQWPIHERLLPTVRNFSCKQLPEKKDKAVQSP